MSIVMFMVALLTCMVGVVSAKSGHNDWIDPTDMIHYDPIKQTMKWNTEMHKDFESTVSTNEPVVKEPVAESCTVNLTYELEITRLRTELSNHNITVHELKKQVASCTALREQTFFIQFVRVLVERFKNFAEPKDGYYEVDIKLAGNQYEYLVNYAMNEKGSIQEVHSVLLSMHQNSRWQSHEFRADGDSNFWSLFQQYLTTTMLVVCGVCFGLLVCVHCPRSMWWISTRFLLILCIASVPWNWWNLYKKEIAARHAVVFKGEPDSCTAKSQSLWNIISSVLTVGDDECARYHKKLQINPMWDVPPSKAIAVTITKFILEPVEHVGESLNKLIKSTFTDLPFHLWIPVYLLLVLLIVLFFFVCSGYRIRTLFFNIEPHRPNGELYAARNHQLETENRRLLELVDSQQTLLNERRHIQTVAQQSIDQPAVTASNGGGDHLTSTEVAIVGYPVLCSDTGVNSDQLNLVAAAGGEGNVDVESLGGNNLTDDHSIISSETESVNQSSSDTAILTQSTTPHQT